MLAHNVSDRTEITATGADRVRLLHGLCTNDVKGLTPGQGCEAFITSVQGKTLGHVFLQVLPDRIVMDTVPGQGERLGKHLNKYVVTEDVTYTETSAERSLWLLAGEELPATLQQAGIELPAAYVETREVNCAGIPARLTRVALLGNNSFLLRVEQAHSAAIENWLAKLNIAVITNRDDLAGLRIQSGWPEFGIDIHEDNLPQEVNRTEIALSFRKGCYLGQETIARLENLGHVNKLLIRLKFTAESLPAIGLEILHDGKVVGKVTSAGFDPVTKQPLAFAMLRANLAKGGTLLESAHGAAEVL